MHMADALVSPAVGVGMLAVSGALVVHSSRKVAREMDDRKVPLMGVVAAFVFAAQMINFTIPGTGSSGHLGGGLLMAILLGPHAAFLTMASVLIIQALFFADGGLLALGCNILNLGFFPCFVAYPLLFKPIAGDCRKRGRIIAGSIAGALLALQLGALAVVLQTVASGITELPVGGFLLLMQPIHLAIGAVEGVATAAIVLFIWRERPEILDAATSSGARQSFVKVTLCLAAAAAIIGGGLSWLASEQPDGLEWAIAGVTGKEELEPPAGGIHQSLKGLQEKTAVLPDYAPPSKPAAESPGATLAGTGVAGLVGSGLTLLLAALAGLALRRGPGGG